MSFLFAGLALAQGTEPKAKPEDYPAHGRAGGVAIGAEYMVHSFSGRGQMYIVKDYLVVEVALYPPTGKLLVVEADLFHLRVNGKRQAIGTQPPQMVAVSLRHPERNPGPTLEAGAGLGNTGVRIGGPPVNRSPFPGAPPAGGPSRLPRIPRPENAGGVEKEEPPPADELVVETALVEGEHRGAAAGYIYFPYKGKTSSIKSIELLYDGAAVKLR